MVIYVLVFTKIYCARSTVLQVYRMSLEGSATLKNFIVAPSFPELGKLSAIAFLGFVQKNPQGLVSLPTGKTPEYFIKWVKHFMYSWDGEEMQAFGLAPAKPCMDRLRFVQMDEFFPISPLHTNSFNYFVNKFYIAGFGLRPENCLLIDTSEIAPPSLFVDAVDLSLLHRPEKDLSLNDIRQRDALEKVTMYCTKYEQKIHEMGGIDLFIGGIGPDGHVAFNIRGSSFQSTTRLLKLNYESMAASAESLGGMRAARKMLVITIGLATITGKPTCQAIIFAAGEAKGRIVKEALKPDIDLEVPSHALRVLPEFSLYLTTGASKLLFLEANITESSHKSVLDGLIRGASNAFSDLTFLHTEPHHDDIMLGYLPFILKSRSPKGLDFFACATSGFNSVSHPFIVNLIDRALTLVELGDIQSAFLEKDKQDDIEYFVSAFCAKDECMQANAAARRFIRNVSMSGDACSLNPMIASKLIDLKKYISSLYPGQREVPTSDFQRLKGMCREFESECLWGCLGYIAAGSVRHLRLGFYTNDLFSPEPIFERDSAPFVKHLIQVRPDVVTLALDPESSGPDTHYKVLRAITSALVAYEEVLGPNEKHPVIWGYRNVWYRFSLDETNLIIPVTGFEMQLTRELFEACYRSQKCAEFPSYLLDGPFSDIVVNCWREQLYEVLRLGIGREQLPPDTQGLIFMKEMSVDELKSYSRSLSRAFEDN